MREELKEWIGKAEGDYFSAMREYRARKHVNHDSACFHAQQCIEKYFKALLEKQGGMIRKIHALPVLLDQCAETYPFLIAMRPDMVRLSVYAVEFRYPGESASVEDAKNAISIMKRARTELRILLELERQGRGVNP